jgi:hypothetical protein
VKRPLLWLALLAHALLASAYLMETPAHEGPDENAHAYYASYLWHTRTLPVIRPDCSPMTGGAAAHHPPLYYAALAGIAQLLGTPDWSPYWQLNPEWATGAATANSHWLHGHDEVAPVSEEIALLRWMRAFSVLCGLLSIALTHRLALAVFPAAPRVADVAAVLLACTPQWTWMHGCLDNGNLATTLSMAALVVLVGALRRRRLDVRTGALCGALAGLALITKLTALYLVPLLGVTYAAALLAWRDARGAVLRSGVGALVALLAISGWSFWRNAVVYGDPFMLRAIEAPLAANQLPDDLRVAYFTWAFPTQIFGTCLAGFGWAAVRLPHRVEIAVLLLFLVAVRGWIVRWRELRSSGGAPLAVCALAVLVVVAGVVQLNTKFVQPQGRYLFPASGPFAILVSAGLVVGCGGWLARWGRARIVLLAVPLIGALLAHQLVFRPVFAAVPRSPSRFYASMHRGLATAPPAARATIELLEPADGVVLRDPPALRWRDPTSSPSDRYSVHLILASGLPIGTFESGGAELAGSEWTMPAPSWLAIPAGGPVQWKVRRLPDRAAGQSVRDVPESGVRSLTRGE